MGWHNLIPNNYHLLNISLQMLLDKTMEQKEQWVKTIEAARTCKLPTNLKGFNYSRNVMRSFLGKRRNGHRKQKRGKVKRQGQKKARGQVNGKFVQMEYVEEIIRT